MSLDYREQLRNLLNRRIDFSAVSAATGIDAKLLSNTIEKRTHLDLEQLQKVVAHLGGEVAIRPHRFVDLAGGERPPYLALSRGDQLDTAGITIEVPPAEKRTLDHKTDLIGLASWVRDQSVPWVACQKKCSAATYCPFAAPREVGGVASDRQCGVMANAVEGFVVHVGTDLQLRRRSELQALVDSAVVYSELALLQAQAVGMTSNLSWLGTWHGSTPSIFASIVRQGQALAESFVLSFSPLDRQYARPFHWIVEGDSEYAFFVSVFRAYHGRELAASRFTNLRGEGKIENVRLLLRQKREEGFEPFLLTDSVNARLRARADKLVREKLLRRVYVHQFKKDFESSFPPSILSRVFRPLVRGDEADALATALASYRSHDSRGFAAEFVAALVLLGRDYKVARRRVDDMKIPAATTIARAIQSQVRTIAILDRPRSEIGRLLKRILPEDKFYPRARQRRTRTTN